MTVERREHATKRAPRATELESEFPGVEVSQLAERESWRKEINRPIYHIHKWWATRLGSVFRAIVMAALSEPGFDTWGNFLEIQNFAGKLVLDPFMGSGTTLGEAVKLGAKAVGCDVNPVSTFMVSQAFTRVPEGDLRAAFAELESEVAREIRRYYQTRDPESGEPIPVLYTFWVKTVTTPDGEVIPLFSKYVFSQDAYPRKKPEAQVVCPSCWEVFSARYDAIHCACPNCGGEFNPQEGPVSGQHVTSKSGKRYKTKELVPADGRPMNQRMYAIMALRKSGKKVYLSVQPEDVALYDEAEARLQVEDLPLPSMVVRPGINTDQARGYNYTNWRDFFNSRQLLCLGLLLRAILRIERVDVQEQMLCLFSSTLEFNNLFCTFKGEGTGAVRHMFSNHILKPERTPLENSVWGTRKSSGTFSTLFESRLIPAKRYLDTPFEVALLPSADGERTVSAKVVASGAINAPLTKTWDELASADRGLMVLNGDSSQLPLPSGSVDAVVTDPPYFDFVHYSELSDFFFAWLSPVLADRHPYFARADSSDAGEVQDADPRVFARHLAGVFSECNRVLKDDGVLAFSFHHSRPEGWAAIYEAITMAGMAVVAAHPVHAELRTASPKAGSKEPISLDAILVCKKYDGVGEQYEDSYDAVGASSRLLKGLEEAGMALSSADFFVVLASVMLIPLTRQKLDFDTACRLLHEARTLQAAGVDGAAPTREAQ